MRLHNQQRMLVQVYRRAANLGEQDYRRLLDEYAGVDSTARSCELWSATAFERVMAALETRLFSRVHLGEVDNPMGSSRWIKDEFHWRRKNLDNGLINSRQCFKIEFLWNQLTPYLEPGQRSIEYLSGIIRQACGRADVGLTALTSSDAGNVIEALKDRIAYAIRDPIREDYPF